ncbi:MAG TPA: hypothetical protein VJ521_12395, partial [Acidobacteriota bacterium]|nr:hypothetical protein [Acidobacteriota bacterium]
MEPRKWLRMFLLCSFVLFVQSVEGDKFLPDDPIEKDPDNRISIPKPQEIDVARMHDFLANTFTDPGGDKNARAQNINTVGEVPDSTWFTNRIGSASLTVNDVARGPNKGKGPDVSKPWTILKAKTGAQPGFVIRDARGDVYFIKFDATETPEAQTAAEIICTKIFHAAGYNVPENYIAYVQPHQLEIEKKKQAEQDKEAFTQEQLDLMLAQVPKKPDGMMRVLASLRLEGEPLGGFRFHGTRSDDPNDIVPHENRRELRGYRIFSAWLNHNDSDSKNTLDMYVTEGDRKFIQHYLIDFGSTLGSSAQGLRSKRAGNEYRVDWAPTLRSIVTFGLWDRPWRNVDYPDYPAVGRFEANQFRPEQWKPDHPNPAFERMQNEDAFWAVRILSRFSDEMVRAVVRTAEISDPAAEKYMADTLIKRRDKIIRYYLGQLNPLADFSVQGDRLTFKNLGVDWRVGKVKSYHYQWHR